MKSQCECMTDAEVEHLVGSPVASLQLKWLDEHGWPYVLSRKGRPRVARAVFEARMGVVAANDAAAHSSEPDWPSSAQR